MVPPMSSTFCFPSTGGEEKKNGHTPFNSPSVVILLLCSLATPIEHNLRRIGEQFGSTLQFGIKNPPRRLSSISWSSSETKLDARCNSGCRWFTRGACYASFIWTSSSQRSVSNTHKAQAHRHLFSIIPEFPLTSNMLNYEETDKTSRSRISASDQAVRFHSHFNSNVKLF